MSARKQGSKPRSKPSIYAATYKGTKNKSSLTRSPRSIAEGVAGELRKQGFLVYPSTISRVSSYMGRAIKKHAIESDEELALGTSALILAGSQEALLEGVRAIKVHHINSAWVNRLRHCPGNLPPHKCIKRSVIGRRMTLSEKLPMLDEMSVYVLADE
jgi:hypothetical protein